MFFRAPLPLIENLRIIYLSNHQQEMELLSKISEFLKKAGHKYSAAVVLAAGESTRMGENKMLLRIGGVPVLAHSLRVLNGCEEVDEIIVVTRDSMLEEVAKLCREYGITKCGKVVVGGASRTESALAGVCHADKQCKVIAIHDGARPFVSKEIVDHCLRMASQHLAAAPAIRVKDTVRVVKDGCVLDTPEREQLFAMQTPQCFDADLIKGALSAAVQSKRSYTDDCAAVEAMGVKIHLTQGSEENIKITTPLDLAVGEAILEKRRGASL